MQATTCTGNVVEWKAILTVTRREIWTRWISTCTSTHLASVAFPTVQVLNEHGHYNISEYRKHLTAIRQILLLLTKK